MAGIQYGEVVGPSQSNSQAILPQTGVQFAPTQQSPVLRAHEFMDKTSGDFGNLPAFLDGIINQHREAEAAERHWEGFTDAAAGLTAEEIREQKPWYAKIFGPSNYEAGAIMYGAQTKVNDLATDWAKRMPQLREMNTEQVKAMLLTEMKGLQGGNAFENAVVTETLERNFAGLIAQHTKERVAWQQTELQKRQLGAASSAGNAYQALMVRAGTLGQDAPMEQAAAEQLDYTRAALMDTLVTGDLQSDESKEAFLMTFIREQGRLGNFYSVQAMLDEGFLDALPIESAERIERQLITAQTQYRNRFSADNPEFAHMVARAQAMRNMGLGGQPMADMAREINTTYAAMTGAKIPYYDDDQVAAFAGDGASSWLRRYERMEDRRNVLQDRIDDREAIELAEARNTAKLTESFVAGGAGEMMNLKGIERGDMDRASTARFTSMIAEGKTEQAVGELIYNQSNTRGSYVNDQIANLLQTNFRNSLDNQISDGFLAQYNTWKSMYDGRGFATQGGEVVQTDAAAGRAAAIAYYTPTISAKMLEFDRKRNIMGDERAYVNTFSEWAAQGNPDMRGMDTAETKANRTEFLRAVDNQSAGWWSRNFGNGFALHPSSRITLANRAGAAWEQLGSDGLLPEHRAKSAINLALQSGQMELVAGNVLSHSRNQMPLTKYMDDPDGERTSLLFDEVLRSKAREAGTTIDGTSLIINRLQDENGVPVYAVHIESDDGYEILDLRGTDLTKREQALIREQTARPTSAAIPSPGFQMDPATSLQASEAYWGTSREQMQERGARNRRRLMQMIVPAADPTFVNEIVN